ncbi:hypothetical protein TESG_04734 [Trichophyton tonsurans CBS 112818]|uniref:Uncharacterized protein n=1 Tax=Trichophyton tonsurans (strain CBS 112818) TaxID=647933 RepID=F2S175_TRIT1|nr:hypothetical protein TESG_04734 [Trichophyton tonsurans CBS 112818]
MAALLRTSADWSCVDWAMESLMGLERSHRTGQLITFTSSTEEYGSLCDGDGPSTLQPASRGPSRPGCIWLATCVAASCSPFALPTTFPETSSPAPFLDSGLHWSGTAPEEIFLAPKWLLLFFFLNLDALSGSFSRSHPGHQLLGHIPETTTKKAKATLPDPLKGAVSPLCDVWGRR